MTLHHVHPMLLGVFLACSVAVPAAAQGQPQSRSVAQFGDWSVYVSTASPKVCYAISQPKSRAPEGLKRDPAYFFVSTRPGENVKNEVTITVGFPLKEGSDATLTVGSMSLQLYTKNEGAWVRNVADEARLVDAMRKGRDLTVVSTSLRGNPTTDKYSLSGIGQALDRVAQECK
ncbi:invasion associated locus B family protein [Xanthobacter sp. AM11]|uniref:invasion associated locus B family protein n=1 Tax=Xanthobacter sp. AM11 TaxID=3380643 RepID=UPI0039BFBB35